METTSVESPSTLRISPYWSGFLFLFRKESRDSISESVGVRLLLAALLVDGWCRPFIRGLFGWSGILSDDWTRLAVIAMTLLITVVSTRLWVRIPFRCIGLYGWQQWSRAEKWFFPEILVVTLVSLVLFQWSELTSFSGHAELIQTAGIVFVMQLIWGFYQEYIYRGLIQTELARRWGAATGILASNVLFTFGPLHVYHFAFKTPGHVWIFAAIFAIGLYFGILFHRSGNLWIVGILHGLGDFFIDGLGLIK